MPCRRQSAPVVSPAACSFRMPTICSSLNRLLRMLSSFGRSAPEDSHYPCTSFRGAPHFLIAPPEDWPWSDYGLVITDDTPTAPSSLLDAYLVFQGGFMAEHDA